jgi:hypothetical protein
VFGDDDHRRKLAAEGRGEHWHQLRQGSAPTDDQILVHRGAGREAIAPVDNPFARVTGGQNDVNDVGQDQGELAALRWPSLVRSGAGWKCQGYGIDQDVKTYQFGIDLPMINACQFCIMLSDPEMADRSGVEEFWRTNEP